MGKHSTFNIQRPTPNEPQLRAPLDVECWMFSRNTCYPLPAAFMSRSASNWFHDAVSALVYSLAGPHAKSPALQPPYNDLTRFILQQHAQLPDYLRAPMRAATLGFDALGALRAGKQFHRQSPESRAKQIESWKNSSIGFQRDLIRYFESLTLLALYS